MSRGPLGLLETPLQLQNALTLLVMMSQLKVHRLTKTFFKHVALAAVFLSDFKLLWNADKVSGPGVGTAAKNHQNQGDDVVHRTPLSPGDRGSFQLPVTHG